MLSLSSVTLNIPKHKAKAISVPPWNVKQPKLKHSKKTVTQKTPNKLVHLLLYSKKNWKGLRYFFYLNTDNYLFNRYSWFHAIALSPGVHVHDLTSLGTRWKMSAQKCLQKTFIFDYFMFIHLVRTHSKDASRQNKNQ